MPHPPAQSIDFDILPNAPYRLDLTAWALKRRDHTIWDRWDSAAGTYSRLIVDNGKPIDVSVSQTGTENAPVLHVTAEWHDESSATDRDAIRSTVDPLVRGLLGTDVDMSAFNHMAARDALIAPLAAKVMGMKPPRYPTLFEALANAITCQQITLTAGLRILARLADTCGIHRGDAVSFPLPENVARMSAQDLIHLGYSRQKARAILELSNLAASGELEKCAPPSLDDAAAIDRLRELYGVGRWSAEYALLRGRGRLNIFPGDDVGVRKHLEQLLNLDDRLDYGGVQNTLSAWQPFAGVIYLQLVVASIVDSGLVLSGETAGIT